jgi:hypothetical protein
MSSVSNGYGGRLTQLDFLAFVQAPSHGVSSSATVPRAGLGPATPP